MPVLRGLAYRAWGEAALGRHCLLHNDDADIKLRLVAKAVALAAESAGGIRLAVFDIGFRSRLENMTHNPDGRLCHGVTAGVR